MKEIELTQGQETPFDEGDYGWLSGFKWCALYRHSRGKFVAFRNGTRGDSSPGIYMHRVIMGAGPKQWVNHIDGDPLNNRRANLRFSDQYGSARARGLLANNSSGFIGVTRYGKGYWARVRSRGKVYSCGVHSCAIGAARARDAKAEELFGEFAVLNFS